MKLLITLIVAFAAQFSIAQIKTNLRCFCCTENHRAFDFWVGDWVVVDSAGNHLGDNVITFVEDSCALQENWTSARGTTGRSLSFYDNNLNVWHQTWIDQGGMAILMDGKIEGESMILYTPQQPKSDGTYAQNKTSWTPLEDGRVHHVWEQTADGGKTWKKVFDGYYSKRK